MSKGRPKGGGSAKLRSLVSSRLRAAREVSGLRMTDVYREVDANSRTIHAHFNGECLPSGKHIVQYAQLFRLPTDYFYGLDNGAAMEITTMLREFLITSYELRTDAKHGTDILVEAKRSRRWRELHDKMADVLGIQYVIPMSKINVDQNP